MASGRRHGTMKHDISISSEHDIVGTVRIMCVSPLDENPNL